MSMDDFTGKVAVITGGASGIGRGIGRALAAEGAHVAVADINADGASQVAAELAGHGVDAIAVPLDVRDRSSVEQLATTVTDHFGHVDVVCNNAGVFLQGPMSDATEDDWRFVLSINLDGMFRVGQVFSALLRDAGRGGHIVNTASIGGFLTAPGLVAYTVSKFGVVAYSDALRVDLAPLGIGVSTLCPGPIRTDLPNSDRLRDASDVRGATSDPLCDLVTTGMDPDEVGPIVVAGIRRNAPYIFTHDTRDQFRARFDAVLAEFDHC